MKKKLDTLDVFFDNFFLKNGFSLGKRQVLSLSTKFFVALVFICVFFVFPVSATESLANTPQSPIATPDVTASILKVSAGLLLVIFAIFGSAWFFRRFGNFSPVANDSLRVIGGLTIGQKEKIVLLQVGEEQVLVGVAPGNIQKLHVLEKPIKLKDEDRKESTSFSESLSDAVGKWKNK